MIYLQTEQMCIVYVSDTRINVILNVQVIASGFSTKRYNLKIYILT